MITIELTKTQCQHLFVAVAHERDSMRKAMSSPLPFTPEIRKQMSESIKGWTEILKKLSLKLGVNLHDVPDIHDLPLERDIFTKES